MRVLSLGVAMLVVICLTSTVGAAINVGGYTFDDNAFADELISSSGSFTLGGGASNLEDALVGSDVDKYAFSYSSGAYVELGFTDNTILNGAGADFVMFELGVPDTVEVSLTIGGTTISYLLTDTGFSAGGFNLNAAAVDLDDFGVSGPLTSLVFGMDTQGGTGTVPSLAAVGALNSGTAIPEPAAIAAWTVLGLMGITIIRRRRR